jgi:hypothetical protein
MTVLYAVNRKTERHQNQMYLWQLKRGMMETDRKEDSAGFKKCRRP